MVSPESEKEALEDSLPQVDHTLPVLLPPIHAERDAKAPLLAIASTSRRSIILVLHHISTCRHGILALLQHAPEPRVPWVRQLDRLQLRLVPYPGVAARIEQDVDELARAFPAGLVERVYVADGFVEGRVALEAVDLVDFDAFLVEEHVEDVI
jgi:hypothetical protein